MPSSSEVQEVVCGTPSSKKRRRRREGGRLYFTNRKQLARVRMRGKVCSRRNEDHGDTIRTLFSIQEEVVLETQTMQSDPSTPIVAESDDTTHSEASSEIGLVSSQLR